MKKPKTTGYDRSPWQMAELLMPDTTMLKVTA